MNRGSDDNVFSPSPLLERLTGQCTIDGIMELEEGKLRVTLIKAVVKATSRAGELLFEK